MSYLHAIKMALICMSGIALSGCLEEEIDARQTELVQGLIYKLHDKEPFSGRITGYPSRHLGLSINNSVCNVKMKNGLPDGQTECHFSNGQLSNQIEFDKGSLNGTWKEWSSANGELATSREYRQNKLHGKSEIYNVATGALAGEYHYQNGEFDGPQKAWSGAGKLITDLHWRDGKRTGFETTYDWEYTWVDGNKHGVQRRYVYFKDKRLLALEEEYQNGLLHGSRRELVGDNVGTEEVYANGVIQSRVKREIRNGKTILEQHFTRNPARDSQYNGLEALIPDGMERNWDQDGHLTKEVQWKKGKEVSGFIQQWRDDELVSVLTGAPDPEGRYLVKHGLERLYDSDHRLIRIVEWDQGKVTALAIAPNLPFSSKPEESWLRLYSLRNVEAVGSGLDSTVKFFRGPAREDYLYPVKAPEVSATTLSNAVKASPNVAECVSRYQQYLKRTDNNYLLNDIDALTHECK